MADTPGRTTSPLMVDLLQSGHQFSFVQVMRLARRFLDPRGAEGLPEVPWQDRVRIRPELSLAFPAADVARVERVGADLRVTATFLGLYGSSSPLPIFYTEDLLDEASSDESVIRDFLDIIHQRLYHLYFQCWSKYRLFIRVVEENNPIDRERLYCLIGLGEKELRDTVPDSWSLLRYAGLLTQNPRSALGLKTLLRDVFAIKSIRITQNVQRMVPIPADQRLSMGTSCCRLGVDAVLGSEIADQMGKFRIEIGPLSWEGYNDLVPGAPLHEKLARYVKFYLLDPLAVDLKLILAAGEAKPLRLGDPTARLGLNTWCFSGKTLGELSTVFPLCNSPVNKTSEPDLNCSAPLESSRSLSDYYQTERARLGDLTGRFAQAHPNLASMVSGSMADPGVEKLLEGTAFYNALLQWKLDDDIPEFIHELTETLHPWNLRPIPATTIVAFTPKAEFKSPLLISAGAEVESVAVQGTKCRFRTCFDVTVHPLTLLNASFSQPSGKAPSIKLYCELNGIGLADWKASSLRFFLGDDYPAACDLYLLLMRYLKRITITADSNGGDIGLPPDSLKPVGFADNETILTNETGLFPGHQILQEYFLFHDKFLFIDLTGLDKCKNLGDDCRFEINFELTNCPLVVPRITANSFVLFAAPVINLFPHKAMPLMFTADEERQQIRPLGKKTSQYSIYSVDRISDFDLEAVEENRYTKQSPINQRTDADNLCQISQSKSPLRDGFDTFLLISSHRHQNQHSKIKLDIDLTCTNGDLPDKLEINDVCVPTATTPEATVFRNIKPVTFSISPDYEQNRNWRLLAGFSLNSSTSLNIANNLRAILRLYIPLNNRNQVAVKADLKRLDAIEFVEAKTSDRLIGRNMYRGYEVRIKVRSDHFVGPGDLYMFSSVLERFLGGYVTQHCFIRLVVEEIGKGYQFEWPTRMGDRHVL